MRLTVAYDFLPKQRSLGTGFVMDHFGIDFEQGRHLIAENLQLDPQPGDIVFFTGPSGSGKSSLLRAAADALERESVGACERKGDGDGASGAPTLSRPNAPTLLWIDRLELPARPLADAMPLPIKPALDLLSSCGLGEAHLLLRTPAELSDGQRYRFRLAFGAGLLLTQHSGLSTQYSRWLVADEFSAALDRTLAKVLAFNLHRLAKRTGIGFLLATTHEDILDDLNPDVLVRCDLDGRICVERGSVRAWERESAPDANDTRALSRSHSSTLSRPKRAVSFFAPSGSAKVPRRTGRTSLGGITAATTCA